jgi:hypothetical protein
MAIVLSVPHRPTVDEAKERLAHLDLHGPTNFAFIFQNVFSVEGVS